MRPAKNLVRIDPDRAVKTVAVIKVLVGPQCLRLMQHPDSLGLRHQMRQPIGERHGIGVFLLDPLFFPVGGKPA